MNLEIERATKVLLGKELWGFLRAVDLAMFQFGERRTVPAHKGGTKVVGDYALHISCAWRMRYQESVVIAQRDLYYPAGYKDSHQTIPDEFDWQRNETLFDEISKTLFPNDTQGYVVKGIHVGAAGSLSVGLSGDYWLEIFPDDSVSQEYWRLFRPATDERHFVVSNRGTD